MGYRLFPNDREGGSWFYWILAGFLFALAGLTRPEAPLFVLVFYSLAIIDKPKAGVRKYYIGLLLSCFTFALIFLPYFFWRWLYYGHLFPNPVYCKGFNDFSLTLDLAYLHLAWPFMLFALWATLKAKDKRHFFLWSPSLVYLGLLIGADPVVAFANRLFLPAFILLLPLTLQGIMDLIRYFLPKKSALFDTYLVVSVLLFAIFFIPKMTLTSYRSFAINPQEGLRLREQVVDWLNKYAKASSQVVLADSGMIPYLSSLNFIDSYCLNNKKMTSISTQNKYLWLCREVIKTKPEIIILTSLVTEGRIIYSPTDVCLKKELKTSKSYTISTAYSVRNQKSSYRYEIYTLSN